MNYQYFKEYLQGGRNKKDRPIANKTRVQLLDDGSIGIKLFNTYVLRCLPDDSFYINSDGWMTLTTRDRINSFQNNITLWQDKQIWYFKFYAPTIERWNDAKYTYLFKDNLHIIPDMAEVRDGSQIYYPCEYTGDGESDLPLARSDVKEKEKLRKQILKYSADFTKEVIKGKIQLPSGGDCFYCQLDEDKQNTIVMENGILKTYNSCTDHLISHMQEKYYVPSLLWKAIRENAQPPIIEGIIYEFCTGTGDSSWVNLVKDRIKRSLRKYLSRRLGLAF